MTAQYPALIEVHRLLIKDMMEYKISKWFQFQSIYSMSFSQLNIFLETEYFSSILGLLVIEIFKTTYINTFLLKLLVSLNLYLSFCVY